MAPKKKRANGNKSRMYLGPQKVAKPKRSWEAQELSDINRNWQRPWGSREAKRQTGRRST